MSNTRRIEIKDGGEDIVFSADLKALLESSENPKTATQASTTTTTGAENPKPYNFD